MNRLQIKASAVVGARHFDAVMSKALVAVLEKSPQTTDGTVWITSGSDSHEIGMHPNDRAFDFRGRNILATTLEEQRAIGRDWAERVQARLGYDYDVFFETYDDDPERDHLHLEFDPKSRGRRHA